MANRAELEPLNKRQSTTRVEVRRHSRIQITSFPPEILFKEFGRPDGKGGLRLGSEFGEHVAAMRAIAGGILRASGLPDVPRVFFTKREPAKWRADAPPLDDFTGGSTIDFYVRSQGFARDSREDLAARMIVAIERMKSNPGLAQRHAFELGQLWTLLRVYSAEIAPGAKGGKKAALTKRARAAAWEQKIKEAVRRYRTVAAYAAKVRKELGQTKTLQSRGYAANAARVKR